MPLSNLLKKASSFILGIQEENSAPPIVNGEVVFCKNNVCVHPPTLLRQDCDIVHHPGYMTISCHQESDKNKPTLKLTWIPNTTLRKNPWTLEKHISSNSNVEESCERISLTSIDIHKTDCESEISKSAKPEYKRQLSAESIESRCSGCVSSSQISVSTSSQSSNNAGSQFCSVSTIKPSNSSDMASCLATAQGTEIEGQTTEDCSSIGTNSSSHNTGTDSIDTNVDNLNIDLVNISQESQVQEGLSGEGKDAETEREITKYTSEQGFYGMERFFSVETVADDTRNTSMSVNNDESVSESTLGSTGLTISIEDCKEDIKSHTPELLTRSPSLSSACSLGVVATISEDVPAWMSSPEMLALQHNLMFPESATASPVVRRAHRCRRFSVDLSQMRSLRLFFNDSDCTCGQLVVASRESQYKILHFHHGGLDHLANVLQEWNFLLYSMQTSVDDSVPYRHFMVCRPEVGKDELHPEEGQIPPVNELMWTSLLNEEGQLEDDLTLRRSIFFGGLEREMRKVVWPFLLHLYSFQSTFVDREQIQTIRKQEYHEITRRRLEMEPEKQENFWKNVQCVVEKDVVRTDRGNPYFAGENNPNIEVMKNILLNYAVYNPGSGYTQGMSDLLAPVLAEIKDESESFWCFVGLMQKAIFVCTPRDNDMDRNLSFLRELIRLMVPDFYSHMQKHADAMELLFCHRWILLCFKREFPEAVALRMWESCWANYLTDYFHLFLCLAIICIYSEDVIAQDLRTDEMLLHFSSLAMYMDGDLILRKARGLVYQFRQMPRIPCTLAGLCQLCGPGMWDSTHAPIVECSGPTTSYPTCSHRDLRQLSG